MNLNDEQQLTAGRQNYFLVGAPCFDNVQIERLKALVDQQSEQAEVHQAGMESVTGSHYETGRRTQVRFLTPQEHGWVYDILTECFRAANQELRYEIGSDIHDVVQLLRYDAEEAGHFRWHADTLPSDMTRKISMTVPLNSPDEYEGGQLQFLQGGVVAAVVQRPGHPVAFPSWLVHQVTPVTRGRRYALVSWMRGPNWR